MAFRAWLNKAKPWACVRGHKLQLVKGKMVLLGAVGSDSSVIGALNQPLLPGSFNLACRHCFSLPTPPPLNIAADYNYPFSFVSLVANDKKGSLSSADFAVRMHNDFQERNICLERVVEVSVIRFGWTIYCLKLEGIDEKGERNVYNAIVLNNLSAKEKRLIKWQLVDQSFPYPSQETRLDFDFDDNSVRILTVGSDTIVPVDIQPDENSILDKLLGVPVDIQAGQNSYKYALSAVQIHNNTKDNKIHLKELLCASKLEVDGGVFHFLLLKAVDDYKELNVYFAILKVSQLKEELIKWAVVDEFFSNPLQKYEKLGA